MPQSHPSRTELEVKLPGRGTVVLLPNLHGHAEFALPVLELIHDCDAVALELSDAVATEVVGLLRDHGQPGRLPLGLGVARLSPGINGQPGTVQSVVVAQTDAMIQAARSALQLGLPIYGVDLDHSVVDHDDPAYWDVVLPDSIDVRTVDDLATYLHLVRALNVEQLESHGGVDFEARNIHMARRLVDLASRHRRLLFVTGLAHDRPLRSLLRDPTIEPLTRADAPRLTAPPRRVVLGPALAAARYDRFPRLAAAYEEMLKTQAPANMAHVWNPRVIFQEALAAARTNCPKKLAIREPSVREYLAFERLLHNAALIRSEGMRRLGDVMAVCRATAESFTAPLLEELLRGPWANPKDYPYPYVEKQETNAAGALVVRIGGESYQAPNVVTLDTAGTGHDRPPGAGGGFGSTRTWPPEDRAQTLLLRRLQELLTSREEDERHAVNVLEASQLDNLAIRQTILDVAEGKPLPLNVLEPWQNRRRTEPPETWPLPVLWVFAPGRFGKMWPKSWYSPYPPLDGSWSNDRMHGMVGYGVETNVGSGVGRTTWLAKVDFFPLIWEDPVLCDDGIIPSPTRSLAQRWVDRNRRAMPIGGSSIGGVFPGLNTDPEPACDLLRLALHYSRGHVTVVLAPAAARLAPDLRAIATQQGQRITVISATSLPRDLLERARVNHLLQWNYADERQWRGGRPTAAAEAAMGEDPRKFADRDFGTFRGFSGLE